MIYLLKYPSRLESFPYSDSDSLWCPTFASSKVLVCNQIQVISIHS